MIRIRFGKFSLTFTGRQHHFVGLLLACVTGAALYAAAITKPHTFSDGDTLSAAILNANFDALYAKVNELDTRVSAEEAKGKSWRLIYETDVTSAYSHIELYAKSGTMRHYLGHQLESANGSTIDSATMKHGTWVNTSTNITSLNFKSTQPNSYGAGSHIEIWARR